MHKYFAATACPGPYLEGKFPHIEDEVNKRLAVPEDTLQQDLDILIKNGIINSPEYWKTKAKTIKHLPELLHNMAEKLK